MGENDVNRPLRNGVLRHFNSIFTDYYRIILLKRNWEGGTVMERMTLCTKHFVDETGQDHNVSYSMLSSSAEWGGFYGVGIEMLDGQNVVEREMMAGLSENKGEVEEFIRRLYAATALPVELQALCDDFISEKESRGKYKAALAAS